MAQPVAIIGGIRIARIIDRLQPVTQAVRQRLRSPRLQKWPHERDFRIPLRENGSKAHPPQAGQASTSQQVHQNGLHLVIRGVPNRHCLGLVQPGAVKQEAIARFPGGLFHRQALSHRQRRDVQLPGLEYQASILRESGHLPGFIIRFWTQVVVKMGNHDRVS